MRLVSLKRHLRLIMLLPVLLSVTSAARVQSQSLQCNPPWGFCYNYCVRPPDQRIAGLAETGAFDSQRTTVAFPWPAVVTATVME